MKDAKFEHDCFVVAPGPSVNKQNLKLLSDKNVIAVAGLFRHQDYNHIKPKYHIWNKLKFHIDIGHYTEKEVIDLTKELHNAIDKNTIVILDIEDKVLIEKYNLFVNNEIIWRNYIEWNELSIENIDLYTNPISGLLIESAIYMALYFKFENIFVLGMDKDYMCSGVNSYCYNSSSIANVGFSKNGQYKRKRLWDSETILKQITRSLSKLKMLYDYKKNIYNLNANKNTYVDVFPKVDYNMLVNSHNKYEILRIETNKFFQMPMINSIRIDYSIFFSKCYNKVLSFPKPKTNYIIYGNGTFGKIVKSIMPHEKTIFVDINSDLISNEIEYSKVYSVKNIENIEYDLIIVSVIGREIEVIKMLTNSFGIEREKIFTF
ncbi:MAG: hypothetical protein GQ570_09740 [Helicobacteraceae bacterium]|nr:hypothetical protein [Helicobacteraceae bacterium]